MPGTNSCNTGTARASPDASSDASTSTQRASSRRTGTLWGPAAAAATRLYCREMAYVLAALLVGLLILLHETGHYVLARLAKMRIVRFSVGFGPALLRWTPKDSETTFQLSAIPLGGYVQIAGMELAERDAPPDPSRYDAKPLWARLAVIAAGPLTNFLTAAVVYAVLFGIGFPRISGRP